MSRAGALISAAVALLFLVPAVNGESEVAIDGGFAYRDLEFALMSPNEVLGTMINRSGRDYQSACFMMKLYNKDERLLKTVNFCIGDFRDGQSRLFRTNTYTNPQIMKGYRITFTDGR